MQHRIGYKTKLTTDASSNSLIPCIFVSGLLHLALYFAGDLFLDFTFKNKTPTSFNRIVVKVQPQQTTDSIQREIPNQPFPNLNRSKEDQFVKPHTVNTAFSATSPFESRLNELMEVYLPDDFLTVSAIPLGEIDLYNLPSPAETGAFTMSIWIASSGIVTRVELDETTTPRWFANQIVEKFKSSRFTPAQRGGRVVASIMRVEVNY